ncbi:cobalamin B12-binding domain-containing protein [Celeribacter sp.]|uniref:cobalamin B12-binding domain-containing protein n=1 Tax=Celeribacter sp. TaxID=1890673 RepID=UPI003A920830
MTSEQVTPTAPRTPVRQQRIRVLVAKLGLDGHDRGAKVVARILRDAGMEVIYSGLYKTPDHIVDAAIQEDVDVIGVSLLSGSHGPLFGALCARLRDKGADHVIVVAGGVIPEQDYPELLASGVNMIVPQEARSELIVTTIEELVAARGPI